MLAQGRQLLLREFADRAAMRLRDLPEGLNVLFVVVDHVADELSVEASARQRPQLQIFSIGLEHGARRHLDAQLLRHLGSLRLSLRVVGNQRAAIGAHSAAATVARRELTELDLGVVAADGVFEEILAAGRSRYCGAGDEK